jgi:hypothetical protein
MKTRKILTFIWGLSLLILYGCSDSKSVNEDLEHVLKISDCDSLMMDSIFLENSKFQWTKTKPNNVVEAVMHLDSMTNAFSKQQFRICRPNSFHFGLGMAIRNKWIYPAEQELDNQLYNTLKLQNADDASGLILILFNQYLTENPINIMTELDNYMGLSSDSMKLAKVEYQRIEDRLNEIKNGS